MRRCWLALVMCAACAAADDPDEIAPPRDDDHVTIRAALASGADDDICELLPADPPCSLACDHDALVGYVPPHSCVVFVCTLTDGRQIGVHACDPN